MRDKIQDKLIGVTVTLVTALICFYFGSFTTKAQVIGIVEAKVMKEAKDNKEKFARQDDVKLLELEMKHLKEGQKEMKSDLKEILRKMQ